MRCISTSRSAVDTHAAHVAIYVPTLAGGGAELSMLRLAGALVAVGYIVDLVVNRQVGAHADRVPAGVRVVVLERRTKIRARLSVLRAYAEDWRAVLRPAVLARKPIMSMRYLSSLADYLVGEKPDVVLSAMFYANLVALWARAVAGTDTPVIASEHNTLSRRIASGAAKRAERARWRYLPGVLERMYPRADAIVAVSDGVAADLAAISGIDRRRITTIHNPVVSPELVKQAAAACDHPWFGADQPPVILSAGRLEAQKNFAALIEAFAGLRSQRPARLMILGEGSERDELTRQAARLGIADDVSLPGWVDNPYAYMSRARLFALSSAWEGLGNVLIEALACGCPVVATDCPSGPREILADGRYGTLVPLDDQAGLADAMMRMLDTPGDAAQRRLRAAEFGIEQSAARYRDLIETVTRAREFGARPGPAGMPSADAGD